MVIRIKLTPAQKEYAEWAIGPMIDIPTDESTWEDGVPWYRSEEVPTIEGSTLIFSKPSFAIDDILYRLREQLRDMADQAYERYPVAAANLADNIEQVALAAGWKRTMGPGWQELSSKGVDQ